MQRFRPRLRQGFPVIALAAAGLAVLCPAVLQRAAAADASAAYTLEVHDASAKVGENTLLVARLRLRDGYRFLHAYNNRVGQLSALNDAVAFERKAVPGTDEDGTLVFEIAVRPVRPGSHPINGVLRVGYIEGSDAMAMVSVPLMARVVGTD